MKLATWIELNRLKPKSTAELFNISHAHLYKYLYENAIPRPLIMKTIYIKTMGAVTPNDFYGFTSEIFESQLMAMKSADREWLDD